LRAKKEKGGEKKGGGQDEFSGLKLAHRIRADASETFSAISQSAVVMERRGGEKKREKGRKGS